MKKRTLTLCVCLVLLLAVLAIFSGCSVSTDGLLEEARVLIEKSAFFNEIYYGEGIPYLLLDKPAIGNYYRADPTFLDEHGFHTIGELKEKTAEVFSEGYCNELFALGFSGFSDGSGGFTVARYCSNQAENLRDENETLLVFHEIEPTVRGTTTYDFSTLKIVETGSDYAVLSLDATVNYPATEEKEAYSETFSLDIRFVYERVTGCGGYDIGWRIDTPTY